MELKKFAAIVTALLKSNVVLYHVDLLRHENKYYLRSGESYIIANGIYVSNISERFCYSALLVLCVKARYP